MTVFTPAGEGRHPLIVINHGRAGDAAGRAKLGRARYAAASRFFTDAGFVVALPVRLGYGVTGGPDPRWWAAATAARAGRASARTDSGSVPRA